MDWVWPSWTQRVLLERLVSSRLFCCFGVDAHERLLMCHTLSMWYRVNTLQSACDIELTHSAWEIHSRCFSRLRGLWWTSDLKLWWDGEMKEWQYYGVMSFSLIIYSTDSHVVSNLDAVVLNRQKLNVSVPPVFQNSDHRTQWKIN